jgi:hypothetical protein
VALRRDRGLARLCPIFGAFPKGRRVSRAQRTVRSILASLCLAIGLTLVASSAPEARSVVHAFTDPLYFGKPALQGGGGGRWFSGAPSEGYDCTVCHTGGRGEELVVDGLPKFGYQPDTTYEIRIAWPVTAARHSPLYDQPPPAKLPATALVAELVSETANDSGSITQQTLRLLTAEEKCHGEERFGYVVFGQPHNRPVEQVNTCNTGNLTRCLVVVRPCGSKEVRIHWTAPKAAQGAIWLSASMVSTDVGSATPEGDLVSTVTVGIPPAGTAVETQLGQSCSLVALRSTTRARALACALVLGCFALFAQRTRARARKARR